jgi:hypothetical protein
MILTLRLSWLADGSSFAGSERRVEPKDPTRKFRLPIMSSISGFPSTSGLLLAKSKKSQRIHDSNTPSPHGRRQLTRVNSTDVLDEGLRIRGKGCRMHSKVKISQTRCVSRINMVLNLAYSQSVPDRPLLAPIYKWPGLKEPVGSDTYYNVCIRPELVLNYPWA